MELDKFEWKKYLYYGIIGIISFIVLVFVPMIGSSADVGFALPTTISGWIIYITVKALVVVLNMIIFYCFMQQAVINVKNNENFIKANDILNKVRNHELIPMSPKKWKVKQYSTKGMALFFSTAISTVALTNAILTYDWMSLLAYVIVITTGVIFGIIQMKVAEAYWTNEYYQYALMKQREEELENASNFESTQELNNLYGLVHNHRKMSANQIYKGDLIKCLQLMAENIETLKNK